MDFAERYGRMAVIAGGSEGVGAAYAHLLAGRGLDVALVARKAAPLEEVAKAVKAAHPDREVLSLAQDLSTPDAPDKVQALTAGREVGLLIYNAGAGDRAGDFVDGELDVARRLLAVNATTMMALCHGYGRAMKARGRGGIITVSSVAALVGNSGLAIYSGSKAFSTLFTEALWHELKPYGVHVLNHMLASTNTPSIARNFPQMAGMGDDPEEIAAQGLAEIENGPVVRTAMGDMAATMLATLPRADAVNNMYEMSAPYRAPKAE